MQFFLLKKDKLNDFIFAISKDQKVVAPVKKGEKHFVFGEVTNAAEIALDYIPTILPPKKYFMPQYENIVEYDLTKGPKTKGICEYEKLVIFGVHTCDLAGIQCLNTVFGEEPKDQNYLTRKENIALIGLECNKYCDEYASCALVGNHLPNGGYDLFFTDIDNYFLVSSNSDKGDELIKKADVFEKADASHEDALAKLREKKKKIFKDEVSVNKEKVKDVLLKASESKVWNSVGEKCLACGNCTNVCPTCYCFNMVEEPELNLTKGKRVRMWDSCQSESFARVAGNENFREERGERQRHRYFRKFNYPVKKFNKYFCTGCGRCTRTCMAEISLKETLEELIKEHA